MGIVRLSGQLICATPDEAALVATHVATHIALTLAEPGCLTFAIVQTENPLVWQVDESFADKNAFDAHQLRTKTSVWSEQTAHIERKFTLS